MKYYFVSDNCYFLNGLEDSLSANIKERSIYVNVNHDIFILNPEPDDVIVLAIFNLTKRREIMRKPGLSLCHLIIMVKYGASLIQESTYTPWFIPWKTTAEDFINILNELKNKKSSRHHPSLKEPEIFLYLGAGFSHKEVAKQLSLSNKYIYAIRRKISVSLGLRECNVATSILLCRDVAEMRLYDRRRPTFTPWGYENSLTSF